MSKPKRFLDGRVTLRAGDCLKVLAQLPDNSVDTVLTDAPYHIASIVKRFGADSAAGAKTGKTGVYARGAAKFVGQQWDSGDIAFRPEVWRQCLRVLKPGGYLLSFAFSRTFARMSVAIEDAGFVTHPFIVWGFSTGYPKPTVIRASGYDGQRYGAGAIKASFEPIYMGQKPFSESSGTDNIQMWGTGALNIDATRFGAIGDVSRWPSNFIHDGSEAIAGLFPEPAFARYFYAAKAGPYDRLWLDHATIKPLDLIQYLCRLVTPAGGLVLDPFAGTGTTGEAAYREGFRALLVERDPKSIEAIKFRMELANDPLKRAAVVAAAGDPLLGAEGTPLFSKEAAE